LVTDPADGPIDMLWAGWRATPEAFAAPALLRYEITNALYRLGRYGRLRSSAVEEALASALNIPIQLHDEPGLHLEATRIAQRFNLPAAYDAHYLALAERLAVEFWTADRRLEQAVASALPWVHLAG